MAGTGKTTLSDALCQRNEHVIVGQYLQLKKIEHLPLFIGQVPHLFPIIFYCFRRERWLTWNEIKGIIYLSSGKHIIYQLNIGDGKIVILDQGPIFQLATLYAFGPESLKNKKFDTWWRKMYKEWSSILDIIVWLDAPDGVLKGRINNRRKKHLYKNSSQKELNKFLADYRKSFQYIIKNLQFNGGPNLLHFNTHQSSRDEIVNEISANLTIMADRDQKIPVQ